MVAMPYILVDIVLGFVSLTVFSVATAALLARYPSTGFYLPPRIRERKAIAFVAHAALLCVAVIIGAKLAGIRLASPDLSDVLFFVGLFNAVILAYQFIDRRYFLGTPQLPRRMLIATVSLLVTLIPALALVVTVVGLFVIR